MTRRTSPPTRPKATIPTSTMHRMLCSSRTIGSPSLDGSVDPFGGSSHVRLSAGNGLSSGSFFTDEHTIDDEDDGDDGHDIDNSQSSTANTFGLLITINEQTGECELSFCPDAHYRQIHPNAYAPAALTKMHKLGGGGSGVAVFEGHHPTLGDVVMKHGGEKDLQELFALATIAQELQWRGSNNNTNSNPQTATDLQDRIPQFRMIYISPNHLGEKRRALWHRLAHMYKYSSRNLLLLAQEDELQDSITGKCNNSSNLETVAEEGGSVSEHQNSLQQPQEPLQQLEDGSSQDKDIDALRNQRGANHHRARMARINSHPKMPENAAHAALSLSESGTVSGHRDIAIYSNGNTTQQQQLQNKKSGACRVDLLGDSLIISIPYSSPEEEENETNRGQKEELGVASRPIRIPGDGYQNLKAIVQDLVKLMKEHKWKFTLGQKRIGGDHPRTGNLWLYDGKLNGKLLDNLVTQKIQLVRDLATLTTPEEKDPKIILSMQKEVIRFEEEEDGLPTEISTEFDAFVGNAIKKNFAPETGRLAVLMRLGRQFRDFSQQNLSLSTHSSNSSNRSQTDLTLLNNENDTSLVLIPEEEIPAHHLGSLTRPGSLMGDTFENVPLEPTVLEMNRFYWRNLIRAAIQPRRQNLMDRTSIMALTRLWTCGLTDAGLHNLFLTEDSLWLFDLGQPQLYSAPAFLTKFLFSFFHTLGMQETPGDSDKWERRFVHSPLTNKLRLTPETVTLLENAYTAFEITLDRLIDELFDRDHSLRWLLIQYVTLQLLSDASFCLQRWTIKGGGQPRDTNHQKGIEKWLWRALWDVYIAYDINTSEVWTKLDVEHPSNRESVYFSDMRDLLGDPEALAHLEQIAEQEGSSSEESE